MERQEGRGRGEGGGEGERGREGEREGGKEGRREAGNVIGRSPAEGGGVRQGRGEGGREGGREAELSAVEESRVEEKGVRGCEHKKGKVIQLFGGNSPARRWTTPLISFMGATMPFPPLSVRLDLRKHGGGHEWPPHTKPVMPPLSQNPSYRDI